MTTNRPKGDAMSRPDDDGPCLELEEGPGLRGTLFPLGTRAVIGGSVLADVFVPSNQIAPRHSLVAKHDDAWHVHDIAARHATVIDGEPVRRHRTTSAPLVDGARISLENGHAVLRFHARRPVLSGVQRHDALGGAGAWATFSWWSTKPALAYAIALDDAMGDGGRGDDVRTAAFDGAWRPRAAPRELAQVARGDALVVVEDIAGVRWSDFLWRTAEQGAALDGRMLLAAVALAAAAPADVRRASLTVGFRGLLVWHPASQDALDAVTAVHQAAHLAAVFAGCTFVPRDVGASVLARHLSRLRDPHALRLESDVRAAVRRLLEAAIADPLAFARVLGAERRAMGELTCDDVRGAVARLFPEARARHERIVDEARLLGADGVRALAR